MDRPTPDVGIPFCYWCGRPMQLVDLRQKAVSRGLEPSTRSWSYIIECCGRMLWIDDDAKFRAAVVALNRYHGGPPLPELGG